MMSLENEQQSAKFETLNDLSLLYSFLHWHAKEFFIKMHSTESSCYRTRKYTVCRRVCASFSREILQAGAVKGLKATVTHLE